MIVAIGIYLPACLIQSNEKLCLELFEPKKVNQHQGCQFHSKDGLINVQAERLGYDGRAVAFVDKKAVFVEGLLPSEQADVKIVSQKRNYIEAKLVNRHSSSEHRQSPPCPYYTSCGGCDLQHLNFEQQQQFKQQQFNWLFKDTIEPSAIEPMLTSVPFYYRHRVRLQVQADKLGFFQRQSKQVVDINACLLASQPINHCLQQLREKQLLPHPAFAELELIEDDQQQLALRLMAKKALSESKQQQWRQKIAAIGIAQVQFEWPGQTVACEQPLQNRWQQLKFTFYPGQFTQVNQQVNQGMLQQAIDWLTQVQALDAKSHCLDLFCGMGNFSLPLAQICEKVVGMESSAQSINCAKNNAVDNELSNCEFIKQDLFAKHWYSKLQDRHFDLLLLDPPRAGCEQVCADIKQINPQWILYVSCQPSTLKRDAQLLLKQGYQVQRCNIMDMFAQSHHVEAMMLFCKQ